MRDGILAAFNEVHARSDSSALVSLPSDILVCPVRLVAQINRQGGVAGHVLQLTTLDDQYEPVRSRRLPSASRLLRKAANIRYCCSFRLSLSSPRNCSLACTLRRMFA